jgi:hypothetical protein
LRGYKVTVYTKWLKNLKDLVNSNKHRTLLKSTRQQTTAIKHLTAKNGASIQNLTVISPDGSFPFKFEDDDGNDSPITSFEGNVKVEFLFSNINQPVLPTLRRIIRSAPTVTTDLKKFLGVL